MTATSQTPTRSASAAGQHTRAGTMLLRLGAIAGPLYVVVSLTQALTRAGFDLSQHAWSLLSNGALGWIQITNLVVAGILTIAGATGIRRAWPSGRGSRSVPLLLGIYGASLIAAGAFRADPAQGFPEGTPADASIMSWHGTLHFLVAGIGFTCLIAACFVVGSRFARQHRAAWAWASRVTGVVFLAGFAGIASGSHGPTTLAFVVAVIVAWTWLTTLMLSLARASVE